MTENNEPGGQTRWVMKPDGSYRLVLTDGSEWGTEEVTDLRNEYEQVKADYERVKATSSRYLTQFTGLSSRVRDQLRMLVDDEDLDIDKANEVLDDLGLEKLAVEYEWNATVELRGYGKAPDEDALNSAIETASITIEAYENGVEDVEVDESTVTEVSSDRVR